jgi:prepilin-type N-terminal cleavage/methylation domain-containing protein
MFIFQSRLKSQYRGDSGFTLVELAIVIVIVGLLVGGVLQGKELVDQAKIRKVISDMNGYSAAITTFYGKYNAIPGDMRNATQFWGEVSAGCTTQIGTGTQTCNGDGDRTVDYDNSTNTPSETFRFWQHLSNANMIKGSYTGATGACSVNCYEGGQNVPWGSLEGTLWGYWYVPGSSGAPLWNWSGKFTDRHIFGLGSNKWTGGGGRWHGVSLTPVMAQTLDTKIDDGMPYQGIMVNFNYSNTTNCTSTGNDTIVTSATYNLSFSDFACTPLIDSSVNF